jgi:hypothetical protein
LLSILQHRSGMRSGNRATRTAASLRHGVAVVSERNIVVEIVEGALGLATAALGTALPATLPATLGWALGATAPG